MAERISISPDAPDPQDVAEFYGDAEKSLRYYYAAAGNHLFDQKFIGYSESELKNELNDRLFELDQMSAFVILAALEGNFRADFYRRCSRRLKDDLSRHFRGLHRQKGNRVSLEDDILHGWKIHSPSHKSIISQLVGALNFRHWFAHGRYYPPKLGRKYDFFEVYALAQSITQELLSNQ